MAESRKVPKLDDLRGDWIFAGQLFECLVQSQQSFVLSGRRRVVKINPPVSAAVSQSLIATCRFNQNASHGIGGGGEEVPPATPRLSLVDIHKAKVRFMHQGGGLQRMAGLLLPKTIRCQFA